MTMAIEIMQLITAMAAVIRMTMVTTIAKKMEIITEIPVAIRIKIKMTMT